MRNAIAVTILGILLLTSLNGCELNPLDPIGKIGIMWYKGEAHKYYNTDQDSLIKATKTTLDELEFPIQEISEEGNVYYMKAGDEGSDRFKVKITAIRHNVAKLSIRVNIMGDKPYAELIYRSVDKQPGVGQFTSVAKLNKAVNARD